MSEDDLLVILSDHGFEKLDRDVYISHLLKTEGFLELNAGKEPGLTNINYNTVAFALDPARIYVNLKDKYPCGSVDKKDREKVLRDLEDLFDSLELNDRKVIRDTHRREEIYSGPFLEEASDLILVGNRGFNLRGGIKADRLEDKSVFRGKHTQDSAFLLLAGLIDEGTIPEKPTVYDVRGIVERALLT